jgi:hypothetical protein
VLFHDIGRQEAPGGHVECLFLQEAVGVVIRNSKFTRCDIMDIYVSPTQGGPAASNVLIENNWFDQPTGGGYYAIAVYPDNGTVRNFTLRYNSINGSVWINPDFDYPSMLVSSNIGRIATCSRSGITYAHNVWTNQRCGPTDRVSPASGFVDAAQFDLHLRPDSRAIAAGSMGDAPSTDMDGDRRPIRRAPDAGADQRETAALSLAGAIGRVRLGMTDAAVANAYGGPRRVGRRALGGRPPARVARYRVPGGELWTLSQHGRVVGVGTTSRHYATPAGFGVGAAAATVPRTDATSCRGATVSRRGGRELVTTSRRGTVTSVEIARRGFSLC